MQQLPCKMVWSFSFVAQVRPTFLILLEDDKRATTSKWFGLFPFILFYSLKKRLDFKRKSSVEKVKKRGKVPKQFCPLVVALVFFSDIRKTTQKTQMARRFATRIAGRLAPIDSRTNQSIQRRKNSEGREWGVGCRGWISRFWGAPILSPEIPKY